MPHTECCGEIRKTPFCPMCGAKLNYQETGLTGLLAHLEKILKAQQDRAYRLENPDRECARYRNGLSSADEAELASLQKTIPKWTAWRNALRKLMETTE